MAIIGPNTKPSRRSTKLAACSDHGYKDQSVVLIKIAWNRSPVSKYLEKPPVLVINNSLVVIGFDEMTPQNMRAMTMKTGQNRNQHQHKKLFKSFVLAQYSAESFDEHYS
ncbi:hypothetical protein AVEN_136920-1 [Araneus ventricosus]|uniref:Uncharacterized protein n=1 Tax=Araneus ventricosus TaxID=182803 RepID=A0A4Y2BI65_ARAVE|nr:hypothetical protein AVEN_136920-1 [Araneus ventricosus]